MPRLSDVNWAAVTDAAPHGNIRRADLRALGVADSTIADRLQTGRWVRCLPGLVRLTGGTPTSEDLLDAALRYGGPDAVVSGTTAVRRHGLARVPDDASVLLLRPAGTRRQAAGHVVFERSDRMPEPVVLDGRPFAPLERAVIDTARLRLGAFDAVRALLAEAVQRHLTTPARLREELEAGSQRWTRLPRLAMTEIEAGTRSTAEGWAREIALELESAGFPPIAWNRVIRDGAGRRLFTPDGWVDDVALAWEIESVEFHLTPEDQERSYRRRALMREHDVELVEHRPSQLRRDPGQVGRDLRIAYARARRRPRPPLVACEPEA